MISQEAMAARADFLAWAAEGPLMRREGLALDACCALVGLRRSGKTSLLFQRCRDLLAQGVAPEAILAVSFAEERLAGFGAADFDRLQDGACSAGGAGIRHVFLDEVDRTDGWALWARRLAEGGATVVVTSSRRLTDAEAAALGDWFEIREVTPFSFWEFLTARGVALRGALPASTAEQAAVAAALGDYLQRGGLPDVFRSLDPRGALHGVLRPLLLGDVMRRRGLRDGEALEALGRALARSVTRPASVRRLVRIAADAGQAMSPVTAGKHLAALEEALVVWPMANFYGTQAGKSLPPKHWWTDTGLLSASAPVAEAALLENVVANELRRRHSADGVVFYDDGRAAVDFFLPAENLALAVLPSLSQSSDLRDRKWKALERFAKTRPEAALQVISRSDVGELRVKGRLIPVRPAAEWLLADGRQA